jgi:aryl-alcohol dehydrogenase-like predicted oxidoreductase
MSAVTLQSTTLGTAGPPVSAIGLGTMTFGDESDEAAARGILDLYEAAGGTLVDTADVYAAGASEEIVGRWLAAVPGRRERIVVSTKGRFALPGQPGGGLSAAYLRSALDASLRRLGLPDVDLYQIHGPDRSTPLEEVAGFLTEALESGRAAYVGVSNLPGWQIAALAGLVGDPRLVAHQTQYSLLVREAEWEIFPAAAHAGMGCLAWGPLAAGWLTGKYRRDQPPTGSTRLGEDPERGLEAWERRGTERTWAVLDALREHADETGRTPAGLALAWVAGRPGVASALVGARTPEQLRSTLDAAGEPLDPATRSTLDALSAPDAPDYPYAFLDEIDPPPAG